MICLLDAVGMPARDFYEFMTLVALSPLMYVTVEY